MKDFIRAGLIVSLMALPAQSALAFPDVHDTETGLVKVEQVIDGLNHPWGLEMLPDGSLLVTERRGKLFLIDPANPSLDRPVANVPQVWARGQGGLLDVAVDPNFGENRTIYLTYSDPGSLGSAGTAIAAARLEPGAKPALGDVRTLWSMKNKTRKPQHFGSRIVFGQDGTLFFTIGDRGERNRAQDPFDAAGSVIRINKDGSIPADNPFADGKDGLPEIWSIGHRNPQGADLDRETGDLWTLAHGARGGDELNQPQAGRNYGWPKISYGTHYSGARIGAGTSAPGLEQPVHYWDPSIAPSGLAFYDGDRFPQWQGNLFAGALKYRMLVRLTMKGGQVVGEEHLFRRKYGRIRDVKSLADGALWLLTDEDNGQILRVTPAE